MTMNPHSQAYLNYIKASLADATRLSPNFDDDKAIEVSEDFFVTGKLSEFNTRALFKHAKKTINDPTKGKDPNDQAKDENPDDQAKNEELSAISVVICPVVFVLRTEHGYTNPHQPSKIAPIVIYAKLRQDGRLIADTKINHPVLVPRDLLEPTSWETTLGTVYEADTAYTKLNLETKPGDWPALFKQAEQLISELTGKSLDTLTIDGYDRLTDSRLQWCNPNSATFAIEALIAHLDVLEKAPQLPLYEKLLKPAVDQALLNTEEQLAFATKHWGQMECRYGLADSQRESIAHYLLGQTTDILAVDGPPGTGKTTLLLSIIATEWVKAALADDEPPLIVAASTNNQAVLNILRAFAEIKEPPGPLAGRWLPELDSYGFYLPSKSKEPNEKGELKEGFAIHAMWDMGTKAKYHAQVYETKDGFATACDAFLAKARAAFPEEGLKDLDAVCQSLHLELEAKVSEMQATIGTLQLMCKHIGRQAFNSSNIAKTREALQTDVNACEAQLTEATQQVSAAQLLRRQWHHHCAGEPWWTALLAVFGIGGMRTQRDLAFLADMEAEHTSLVGKQLRGLTQRNEISHALLFLLEDSEKIRDTANTRLSRSQQRLLELDQAIQALRCLVPESDELTLSSVQAALDMGPRFTSFKLATHYWEARYLLEVGTQLRQRGNMDDNKAPEKLLRQYRRLAKLYPCFVSTFYTLPKRFTGYMGPVEQPLYEEIDLLIVDEAGQVSPEIGVPSFVLAKRALVVGDVDQIKPVWKIPQSLDLANGELHEFIPAHIEKTDFLTNGFAASAGSLMQLAQRATPFAKHPRRGRGMFLSEHRRCWPEIINICNRLVYQDLLQPCRTEGPRKLLPTVAYAHLPGLSEKQGTSRYNEWEAKAIATWLVQHKTEIEDAFKEDGKTFGELVAVITPFSAQAKTIRSALNNSSLGKEHGITVGTVHALQGAERRVILFSPTYGVETKPGEPFFDKDASLLNVAISRAQDAFLIFGNMHLFHPAGKSPSAILGRMLFNDGQNEITDLPTELLVPKLNMSPVALIRDLDTHCDVLVEAFKAARIRLVIVSPYLTRAVIQADKDEDNILTLITKAVANKVRVTIVTDPILGKGQSQNKSKEFNECIEQLRATGAFVHEASIQGVHSKLILVDFAWLVVGSFNWLSAVRESNVIKSNQKYIRYESSFRYEGEEAFEMIGNTLIDLKQIIGLPQKKATLATNPEQS